MAEYHSILKVFRQEFPELYVKHEALGAEIHENGGPLPEKVRRLIKIGISAATQHNSSLETHIIKAREAGAAEAEIKHALLLVIQTAGFPMFMEAYNVYKNLRRG